MALLATTRRERCAHRSQVVRARVYPKFQSEQAADAVTGAKNRRPRVRLCTQHVSAAQEEPG